MKKVCFTLAERILGLCLGVLLAWTFFLVAVVNVPGSQSFYLGQDKRYVITYRMSLQNADRFRDVYHSLQGAFGGSESFNLTLYRGEVPEELTPAALNKTRVGSRWVVLAGGEALWSESEETFLRETGRGLTIAKWLTAALYLPLVAWMILRLRRHGRRQLAGVGWYAVFSAIVAAALANILLAVAASKPDLLPAFSDGIWLRVVFSRPTQSDMLSGIQWFYDFLMLIPLGIGTALIRLSVKKDNDPGEDYLYQ